MDDNTVLIAIKADVADINSKLTDIKGYISNITDEAKKMGEQSQTSWQMMAAGIASVIYIYEQVEQVARKLLEPILSVAQAYGVNEQAILRLTGVLAAHGVASEAVVTAYRDMADAFQSTTKYSHAQIISIQEILTSWGVMPSKMKEAIETTIALAVRTGDLGSAAEVLGQAFDGNTRRLGRLLPGIRGLEVGSLTAGDAMKRIRDQIGETAQQEAEGYIGKVKQMDNAWTNFKETLGQYVVPLLKSLITTSIEGIHALEGLAGVNSLAWKQKELQIIEAQIKAYEAHGFTKVGPEEEGGFDIQQFEMGIGIEETYARRKQLIKEIGDEEKKNEKALKDADDDFNHQRRAALDALAKKWDEIKPKLIAESDTAELDKASQKIGEITAQAAKLRIEFRLIPEAGTIITDWEEAQKKKLDIQRTLFGGTLETDIAKQGMEQFQQKLDEVAKLARGYRQEWGNSEVIQWWERNKIAFIEADHAITEQIKDWDSLAKIIETSAKSRLEHEKTMFAEKSKLGENTPLEQMNAELDFDKKALEIEKSRLEVQLHSAMNKNDSAEKEREIREITAQITENEQKTLDIEDKRNDRAYGMTWGGGAMTALNDIANESLRVDKVVGDAVKRIFDSLTDRLTDFITTGKFSVQDFANFIIKEFVRAGIQTQVTGQLAPYFSGLLGSIFGTPVEGGTGAGVGMTSQEFQDSLAAQMGYEAKGDAFYHGHVISLAKGAVLSGPTLFRGAHGLIEAGEAGYEGFLPLARMADGKLGVHATSPGNNVAIQIHIPVSIPFDHKKMISSLRSEIEDNLPAMMEKVIKRHM